MNRNRPAARHAALALALIALAAFAVLAGGEALRLSSARSTSDTPSTAAEPPTESSPKLAGGPAVGMSGAPNERGGPGAGVVIGRLFDARSGLPTRDGGVTLLELGRRTISLPDGQFRFDGIPPGVYTVVIGPAEGYVPASRSARVLGDGADLGGVPLMPADPPTLIVPEFGGRVAACGSTQLLVPTGALIEESPLQLTCIGSADSLPAPAPAGRLPLASIDLAPGDLALIQPARLSFDLPVQPRYSAGISLDLLRLDLERLVWTPTGSLVVDEGGRTASGEITALGTYMAAAPPFGTFVSAPGQTPELTRINTAARPAGEPEADFAAGVPVVYLSFDYARMSGTLVRVRTVDAAGDIVYESERRYDGEGREDLPMVSETSPWPAGRYVSTLYVGQPATLRSLEWRVGQPPEQATDGPMAGLSAPPPAIMPAPARQAVAGCPVPSGWYAYTVQPGDTLAAIAARTGSSVSLLAGANCLEADRILAGQALYLPTITWQRKPPVPIVAYPTKVLPPALGQPTRPASVPTAGFTPRPPSPEVKPTRPPDPTLAPRPIYPTLDPGRFMPTPPPPPPPPTLDLSIRRQPDPGAPGGGLVAPKQTRPPDPTLAPRP